MRVEERKCLIEMAKRRAKPGSGGNLSVVREDRATYGWDTDLPDLGDIRYIIVGGLATALYMPQRMTLDTDLLILSEDLGRAEELLKKAECKRTGTLTIGGSSWLLPGGRSLDMIAMDHEWVDKALASAVRDEDGTPFASLPFLVLMKLESGRLQDLADISRMLGCADESQVDEVRKIIISYRPQDMDDLESMLALGRLEHE